MTKHIFLSTIAALALVGCTATGTVDQAKVDKAKAAVERACNVALPNAKKTFDMVSAKADVSEDDKAKAADAVTYATLACSAAQDAFALLNP